MSRSATRGERAVTDPRISRRRRAVARTKRKRIVTGVGCVAALGALAWVALASPLLAVDEVKVVGAKHTTSEDVARVAGLGSDDNLLLLSIADVEMRAETLPWVKDAEVDRMLPGTVRVRITERVPAMVVSLGAARWTIDSRGYVLDSGAVSDDLPVLGGAETGDIEVGAQLTTPEIQDALKAFRSMSGKLRADIVAVVAPTFERISFSLTDGTLIRFGAAERLQAKNEVLDALLKRLDEQGRSAAYIDVRVPTSPAVAPRTSQATPAPSPSA
ncbi:MAG: cell division protein FtsQ [Actinomycetota bacterium]|nr:cell division protein FtsQ [Actinomycetota bacterium]